MNITEQLPAGRGMYIWRLAACEGGDVEKIIAKCQAAHVRWVAIKVGNGGSSWIPTFRKKTQFTAEIVQAFHDAGIKVFGWSYDYPRKWKAGKDKLHDSPAILEKQAKVYSMCAALGADGVVSDSEYEWDLATDPDGDARRFGLYMRAFLGPDFPIGDAPWPYTGYHPNFPFTKFGGFVNFRCPQVYWMELGGVKAVFDKYETFWNKYEKTHPRLPHYPSGSLYDKTSNTKEIAARSGSPRPIMARLAGGFIGGAVTAFRALKAPAECKIADVAYFEARAKAKGCPGVLHWEFSQVPERIWNAFISGEIPDLWG